VKGNMKERKNGRNEGRRERKIKLKLCTYRCSAVSVYILGMNL
jgi:hypothetical protein